MTIETIIAFAIACFVLMATPGPGTMATVARGLAHGFGRTLSFILGIAAGDLAYLYLAIFGLSALANAYSDIFFIIRWAGAAYLVYLGVKAWRTPSVPLEDVPVGTARSVRDFLGGLSLTLGNPKTILFYTAFLPTFIDLRTLDLDDIMIATSVVLGVLIFVLVSYAWLADRSRRLFRSVKAVRLLNRSAGTVMFGAGVVIAARQ